MKIINKKHLLGTQ